ncbi:MAG TPA: aldo/keto reductase [Acidimicrobiales bacterium]|nr:aldo/keto reductase [Acidimicrobiales bacterium]
MKVEASQPAKASGEFLLSGVLPVTRLGFGSMRLTGPGVWGDPKDPQEAVRVLRRAVELGVNLIDTADSYGPVVAEQLIRKALYPYPEDLVIATKAGLTRSGPNVWRPVGRPEYLRQQAEMSLRNLGLEQIKLFQLHRVDPKVPLEESVGELKLLQDEGKIAHVGLSNVDVDQLERARKVAVIASVQNRYNVSDRASEPVLDQAEISGMGFIPWFPLATGQLAEPGGPLAGLAARHDVTPSQIALAWLLRRSPCMLPIPGTSSVAHLEEDLESAFVELSDAEFESVTDAVS